MAHAKIKSEVTGIVSRYIQVLKQNGLPVKAVYVFGSFAKNQQNRHSDIDLAIVIDQNDFDHFSMHLKLMKLRREVDLRIEPHPLPFRDYKKNQMYLDVILPHGLRIGF